MNKILMNMNIKQRLLSLDTASISDALDSLYITGGLKQIKPLLQGKKIAGPAYTVQYEAYQPDENIFMNAGNYIDDVPEGYVIVIDNQGRDDCTNWGNILTTKAKIGKIAGTVINGSARDIFDIRKMDYPLFACNTYMVSGKNRTRVKARQSVLNINDVKITPGDWIVADDNGVIVIPKIYLEEVILRAENIEKTEQSILNMISNGKKLEEARTLFRYDTPWRLR